MDRIATAAEIVNGLNTGSLLDVGCRNCTLKHHLRDDIEYCGADLFQSPDNCVKYVGDINSMDIGRSFDCVVALDVLEHVDDPHGLIDKLFGMADKYLIVSLPNNYDFKSKYNYLFKNSLGGKYQLGVTNSLDRHRWVMNYNDIVRFYRHKASEFACSLKIIDIRYGAFRRKTATLIGLALKVFFPKLATSAVVGLFEKE